MSGLIAKLLPGVAGAFEKQPLHLSKASIIFQRHFTKKF
jgi:hypothetical protein